MKKSVFMKMLDGEIPFYEVYKDKHFFAILDINPLTKGHTLLIPKTQHANIHELDDETLWQFGIAQKRVISKLEENLDSVVGFSLYLKIGKYQLVPHVHLHIIPRYEDDFGYTIYDRGPKSKREEIDKEWAKAFVAK